jgi:hypothetical protein
VQILVSLASVCIVYRDLHRHTCIYVSYICICLCMYVYSQLYIHIVCVWYIETWHRHMYKHIVMIQFNDIEGFSDVSYFHVLVDVIRKGRKVSFLPMIFFFSLF